MVKRKKDTSFLPDDMNKTSRRLAEAFTDGSEASRLTIVAAMHRDVASGSWFPTDVETDQVLSAGGTSLLKAWPNLNAVIRGS